MHISVVIVDVSKALRCPDSMFSPRSPNKVIHIVVVRPEIYRFYSSSPGLSLLPFCFDRISCAAIVAILGDGGMARSSAAAARVVLV
jgi:hypothetical protein